MMEKGKGEKEKPKTSMSSVTATGTSSDVDNNSTVSSFPLLSEGEEVTMTKTVSKASILSKKIPHMFERNRIEAIKPLGKTHAKNKKIMFNPLTQYVELVTFDSTCREAEEVLNIFIRTGLPTAQIFDRSIKVDYCNLKSESDAGKYWDGLISHEETFDEQILSSKEELQAGFENRVSFIEQSWSYGLAFEEEIDLGIEQMLFPEGDRELVEEQNYELIESILSMIPVSNNHLNINTQEICEVFTNFVSLSYIVGMLNEGAFKSKITYILSHPLLEIEHQHYDISRGKEGIDRILELFEAEAETFSAVQDDALFRMGSLSEELLNTLSCRVLVKVDDDDESDSFLGLGGTFGIRNQTQGDEYFDLISKQYLKIVKTKVTKSNLDNENEIEEYSEHESAAEMFYETSTEKFITNPTPIIVPHTWQNFDLLSFLLNPWNAWNSAKVVFLRHYFDLLNQMMVSACINNNIFLLNHLRVRSMPDAFKTKLLAHCSFADNSKQGTVQLAVFKPQKEKDKKKTRKTNKRYLAVNSSSFYLNPLVRADLYFSYTQHCLLNQPCSGHKGLLLLYMLRMGRNEIAELLMTEGVSVNYKVCSLPARSMTFKEELTVPISGTFVSNVKKDRNMTPNVKETEAILKHYVEESGIIEDKYIRLVAKSTKYTPLAAAVETALETGNNQTVNCLIAERGARVSRGDFCVFRAILPFLRQIAGQYLSRKDEVTVPKRFSLLPMRRRRKYNTNLDSDGLTLLNTQVPLALLNDMKVDLKLKSRMELVFLLVRSAKLELPQMDDWAQTVYLKSVLLHICLMYKEWDVVRFLIQNTLDSVNKKCIEYTFDIFLYDLIKGSYPFAGAALNAIFFLMSEFNIFPSAAHFERLIQILGDGLLCLPLLKTGTNKALRNLFSLKQIQYIYGPDLLNQNAKPNFIPLIPMKPLDFDTFKDSMQRFKYNLCIGLYKHNLIDIAQLLLTEDLKMNITFLNDLLTLTTLDNSCVLSLKEVYDLAQLQPQGIQKTLDYVLLASIHSNGLAIEFIRCGALHEGNVGEFLYTILVQFEGKLPQLQDTEIIADFSYVFTLMAVVEVLKLVGNETKRNQIYEQLFQRLLKADNFWLEGMQYVFDYGKVKFHSDCKSDLEALVDQECQYIIIYDPIRSLVSFSNVGTSPLKAYDSGTSDGFIKASTDYSHML